MVFKVIPCDQPCFSIINQDKLINGMGVCLWCMDPVKGIKALLWIHYTEQLIECGMCQKGVDGLLESPNTAEYRKQQFSPVVSALIFILMLVYCTL